MLQLEREDYQALPLNAAELLTVHLSHHDLKRLELYSRNIVDHHMITDLLPTITKLLFHYRLADVRVSYLQLAIIVAIGLQYRDIDSIATELDLPANQVMAFFNKTVRKISSFLRSLVEAHTKVQMRVNEAAIQAMGKKATKMDSLAESLAQTQAADAAPFQTSTVRKQQVELLMAHKDLSKHKISADISQLQVALDTSAKRQLAAPSVVSVQKSAVLLPAHYDEVSTDDFAAVIDNGSDKMSKKEKKKHDRALNGSDDTDETAKKKNKKHKKA
jgi:N-acetyltransferase 10